LQTYLGLGRVTVVTDASFAREVEASTLPVVLDCWAVWCSPCRMIASVLEELAVDFAWRVKFAKLNTDENPAVSARYNLSSIPTLLLFRDGQYIGRIVGAQPKTAIVAELRRFGFV
jgi:thioredoxin